MVGSTFTPSNKECECTRCVLETVRMSRLLPSLIFLMLKHAQQHAMVGKRNILCDIVNGMNKVTQNQIRSNTVQWIADNVQELD